jgi:thioredoxin-related protein
MQKLAPFIFSILLVAGAHAAEYPKMGEDIYDTQADGGAQIEAALTQAKAEGKNVMIMFGANWCVWCHRFHHTISTNADIAVVLKRDFVTVMVDLNTRNGTKRNAEVNLKYGNPMQHGLPVLVMLDDEGKQLTTQETGALEEGAGHSPDKITAFLAQWSPQR